MKHPLFPACECQAYDSRDRGVFRSMRATGIGGSDAATIMGANPYTQPLALWMEKRNPDGAPDIDNDAMYWGRRLEGVVREVWAERTGLPVFGTAGHLFRHPDMPWMLANLDGAVGEAPADIYEGKTAGDPDAWGPSESDEYPEMYLWQCQHYMAVTGAKQAYLAVLIRGRDFRQYVVPRDQDLIDALVSSESAFWTAVQAGVEPDIDLSCRDASDLIKARYPWHEAAITLPSDAAALAERYMQLKNASKVLESDIDACRMALQTQLRGASRAAIEGSDLQIVQTCSYRTQYDVPDAVKAQYARKSDKPVITFQIKQTKSKPRKG